MTDHLQKPIKVAGHLSEKRGVYQMVLSWSDEKGERHRKSLTTGLPMKGNKKRAEDMLSSNRKALEKALLGQPDPDEILFADFMENWLDEIRGSVRLDTFGGYQLNVQTNVLFHDRHLSRQAF